MRELTVNQTVTAAFASASWIMEAIVQELELEGRVSSILALAGGPGRTA